MNEEKKDDGWADVKEGLGCLVLLIVIIVAIVLLNNVQELSDWLGRLLQ